RSATGAHCRADEGPCPDCDPEDAPAPVRIVLDTNVLMSGLFWRGTPARILDGWRDRHFDLLISPEVYSEYERVSKELGATRPEIDPRPFLRLVLSAAFMVD